MNKIISYFETTKSLWFQKGRQVKTCRILSFFRSLIVESLTRTENFQNVPGDATPLKHFPENQIMC